MAKKKMGFGIPKRLWKLFGKNWRIWTLVVTGGLVFAYFLKKNGGTPSIGNLFSSLKSGGSMLGADSLWLDRTASVDTSSIASKPGIE